MKCRVCRGKIKPKYQKKAKERYNTCTTCWRFDRKLAKNAKRLLG